MMRPLTLIIHAELLWHHLTIFKSGGDSIASVPFNMAMQCVSVKFIPRLLTMMQKQVYLELFQDFTDGCPNFLNIVITDEPSALFEDTTRKLRCSHHGGDTNHFQGKKKNKTRRVPNNIVMLIFHFWLPFVMNDYTQNVQNITRKYCLGGHLSNLWCVMNANEPVGNGNLGALL